MITYNKILEEENKKLRKRINHLEKKIKNLENILLFLSRAIDYSYTEIGFIANTEKIVKEKLKNEPNKKNSQGKESRYEKNNLRV